MDQHIEKRTKYPEFMKIVDLISSQNPLQSKRTKAFIASQDKDYWEFAENISTVLNRILIDNETKRTEIAQAYNALCMEMLREQIKFCKTGVYPAEDVNEVQKKVYDQPETMYRYMIGLLVTQMLWPNHYKLFRFFQNILKKTKPSSYLEVGAGHGMFILEALRRFPNLEVDVCDISITSINISKKILSSFDINPSKIQFTHQDFFDFSRNRQFDFITLGEVLEHVKDPVGFLKKTRNYLSPGGTVYISTCANCPAIDHVYHFHSMDEIRKVILDSNFLVADEIVLPSEDIPAELWEKQLITVNYGAKLQNKEDMIWTAKN